jgi:hypothetical protein
VRRSSGSRSPRHSRCSLIGNTRSTREFMERGSASVDLIGLDFQPEFGDVCHGQFLEIQVN